MVLALQRKMVAVDLETTGVRYAKDSIIEVGAVKFRDGEIIDKLSVLVNPNRRLDPFIVSLTGITQKDVDSANSWLELREQTQDFLEDLPIVGHNVGFDINFLQSHGIRTPGERYDTYDLASVVMPFGPDYRLQTLVKHFGARNVSPHRALSDALATMQVFLQLVTEFDKLDTPTLRSIANVGEENWSAGLLAKQIVSHREVSLSASSLPKTFGKPKTPAGFDLTLQLQRTSPQISPPPFVPEEAMPSLQDLMKQASSVYSEHGALSRVMPGFEPRPQQAEMSKRTADALLSGCNLVVEAGTGVGKSLGYLVPAILFAYRTRKTVVISTNTINLQEQLLNKDIPIAIRVVREIIGDKELNVAQLKGRRNYLCYRRWSQAAQQGNAPSDEARLIAKCMNWLVHTKTGDSSELALGRSAHLFTRLSAQGARGCPPDDGPCFLRKAREESEFADVVIINHSLLAADMAMGGQLLPMYSALIIDEAHRLLDAATDNFGFQTDSRFVEGELTRLVGERGAMTYMRNLLAQRPDTDAEGLSSAVELMRLVEEVGSKFKFFFDVVWHFTEEALQSPLQGRGLRLASAVRKSLGWTEIQAASEEVDATFAIMVRAFKRFADILRRLFDQDDDGRLERDLTAYFNAAQESMDSLNNAQKSLKKAIQDPDDNFVYWVSIPGNRNQIRRALGTRVEFFGAPLDVSEYVREALFKQSKPTILTGATLAYEGNASLLRSAIGLDEAHELILDSPFRYEDSALVLIPVNIPSPKQEKSADALTQAIRDIVLEVGGRSLVLFTSRSALEHARRGLMASLKRESMMIFAQGVDGTPKQLAEALSKNKRIVGMGLNSMWEGVDIEDASLDALILSRLPFNVPSDPVFAARFEKYERGFEQYSIPEAVRRFRQGFGRLIRSSNHRGLFAVLDSRIVTQRYGQKFLDALPNCRVVKTPLNSMRREIAEWYSAE